MKLVRVLLTAGVVAGSQCNAAQHSGQVVVWGMRGQAGVVETPTELPKDAVAVAAGAGFGLALRSDGTVFGWGSNQAGQSSGTATARSAGGLVSIAGQTLTNMVAIAAGQDVGFAIRKDGTLVGWGNQRDSAAISSLPAFSAEEQTAELFEIIETPVVDPATGQTVATNRVQVPRHISDLERQRAANTVRLGRGVDGTIMLQLQGQSAVPLNSVSAIAAHGSAVAVVMSNGSVLTWSTAPGIEVKPAFGISNAVGIAVGGGLGMSRNLALSKGGEVLAWGSETTYGDMKVPKSLTNVVAVTAGFNHSLALLDNGTVFGWGFNESGQATGAPTGRDSRVTNGLVVVSGQTLSNVVAVAAHDHYSLALKREGVIVGWGRACPPIPESLSNVVAIAIGPEFCLAIQTNTPSRSQR